MIETQLRGEGNIFNNSKCTKLYVQQFCFFPFIIFFTLHFPTHLQLFSSLHDKVAKILIKANKDRLLTPHQRVVTSSAYIHVPLNEVNTKLHTIKCDGSRSVWYGMMMRVENILLLLWNEATSYILWRMNRGK